MLKRFNKIFGIQDSIEEEKKRFVQRVNQIILENFKNFCDYEKLFRTVCFGLSDTVLDRFWGSGTTLA